MMKLSDQEIDKLFKKVFPENRFEEVMDYLSGEELAMIYFRAGYKTALEGYQQVPALLKGKNQ